jgi:hypothetical protein
LQWWLNDVGSIALERKSSFYASSSRITDFSFTPATQKRRHRPGLLLLREARFDWRAADFQRVVDTLHELRCCLRTHDEEGAFRAISVRDRAYNVFLGNISWPARPTMGPETSPEH